MKRRYILLTIIGTVLPNIFVFREMTLSGNFLLYSKPLATFEGMFANNISSAFVTDLLYIVLIFLFWSYQQSVKYNLKYYWLIWLYTFAFGIAGGLPLFLYYRSHRTGNDHF